MERLVSTIEAFFRPRDNYTTGSRTMAFLLAALAVFTIENALDKSINPWVTALIVAGSLNLFALIFNIIRSRRERDYVVLNDAREQVIQLVASLSAQRTSRTSPEFSHAVMDSMMRAESLLRQAGIDSPFPQESNASDWRMQASHLMHECDDQIAKLKNRPGWSKRVASFFLGPSQSAERR